MAVAIDKGNHQAMIAGIVAMIAVIVFTDFVIWAADVSWTAKFAFRGAHRLSTDPFMTLLYRESKIAQAFTKLMGGVTDRGVTFLPSFSRRPARGVREKATP